MHPYKFNLAYITRLGLRLVTAITDWNLQQMFIKIMSWPMFNSKGWSSKIISVFRRTLAPLSSELWSEYYISFQKSVTTTMGIYDEQSQQKVATTVVCFGLLSLNSLTFLVRSFCYGTDGFIRCFMLCLVSHVPGTCSEYIPCRTWPTETRPYFTWK